VSQQSSKPVREFRAANVRASIWRNQAEVDGRSVTRFSIRIEKRFRDARGNWQSTSNLVPQDIAKLQLVAAKAYGFCVMGEDETGSPAGAES
jgi:hypothetical protein